MVKILSSSGEERKFDSKDVEGDLKAAGLPERVAEEVAERVEDRVEDNMPVTRVNEQIDVELTRLEEDIQRAHSSWSQKVRVARSTEERMAEANKNTFIPETERERHERRL